MLWSSFRSLWAHRLLPGRGVGKQALIGLCALSAAACGGGPQEPVALKTVSGADYRFAAPAAWTVKRGARTTSAADGEQLVSVTTFPLTREFRAALWSRTVPELDRVASRLAGDLGGDIESSRTTPVAGRRARVYDIHYEHGGKQLVERIAFVLSGRREYQLLCRFESDDDACAAFLAGFRLD